MALSLDQLKAAFKTPERTEGNNGSNYFPFWNMKPNEQATIRFLPDANQDNPMGFLVEKSMHTLNINGEKKSVPCLRMYGEDCPVCKVSAAYYKAEDKENGKKYWRKKQYIAQALVVEDPLPPNAETQETHEGKVRFIALGFSLYKIIKDAFESGELEEIPFAYKGGTNFIIKKDKQGNYASYNLSKFSRKSSDLDEDTIATLELADLSTLLPKNPGRGKLEEMLEADISGEALNSKNGNTSNKRPSLDVDGNEDDEDIAPPATKTASTSTNVQSDTAVDAEAEAVLATIRARRSAAKK